MCGIVEAPCGTGHRLEDDAAVGRECPGHDAGEREPHGLGAALHRAVARHPDHRVEDRLAGAARDGDQRGVIDDVRGDLTLVGLGGITTDPGHEHHHRGRGGREPGDRRPPGCGLRLPAARGVIRGHPRQQARLHRVPIDRGRWLLAHLLDDGSKESDLGVRGRGVGVGMVVVGHDEPSLERARSWSFFLLRALRFRFPRLPPDESGASFLAANEARCGSLCIISASSLRA